MVKSVLASLLIAAAPGLVQAQAQPAAQPAAADTQVVVPQVERRTVQPPRFPSNDFEIGLFAGTFSTQNFGSSAVYGLRLGYHITEDVFVEGAFGQTKVSDEAFRQVLPGGIFVNPTETLSYVNLSAGYNLLPGEVFFGRNVAKASAFYVIGGIGSTKFIDQRRQTFNVGFGTRLLFNDSVAVQADVRDHIFSLDILGRRESTQNLEVTLGVTVFF
ncbi:outer membrane beta-barrel domain-containing protein [Rubrivivax sp. RP6-9]|uniref:outer membrane beta-barrel domain-containing protein n=1 Tax=Rubrivivax sp. RP6-9 TaxID=3415750 RepID=UPI003CC55DC2